MSIAYETPADLTAGAPSSSQAAFTWSASALLGSVASLLHFETSETQDEAGVATWTRETDGSNVSNNVTLTGPSGAGYFFAAGSEGRPQQNAEHATDNGTKSLIFVNNGGFGGNRADLLSTHVAGFHPNTEWTIEGFFAKGDIDNFGNTSPTLWHMDDSDINGVGATYLELIRNGFGGNLTFIAGGTPVGGGSPISVSIDSGVTFENEQWYHIAVSKRDGEYQMFVDGALVGSASATTIEPFGSSVNICLGFPRYAQDPSQPGLRLIGWVDEFRYVREHTVYWDDTHGVPQHDLTGFSQGYVIYRDGVQIDVVDVLDGLDYTDTDVVAGTSYEYQVGAWDGVSLVSELSEPITIGVTGLREEPMVGFNDEVIFQGYLGGRLKGTTVACPGDNANEAKPCC